MKKKNNQGNFPRGYLSFVLVVAAGGSSFPESSYLCGERVLKARRSRPLLHFLDCNHSTHNADIAVFEIILINDLSPGS